MLHKHESSKSTKWFRRLVMAFGGLLLLVLIMAWLFSGISISIDATGEKVKSTDVINVLLTATLVTVTIFYAISTAKYVRISQDMAKHMATANQINFRPYVLIEELPPNQIQALANADARNSGAANILARGYPICLADQHELLLYNISNLGAVPARAINHVQYISIVDEASGEAKEVSASSPVLTTIETLLPRQTSTRSVVVPLGTFYQSVPEGKHVLITLKVTYRGNPDLDPNTYYYTVTLRSNPSRGVAEMNQQGVGGVAVIASDDGIEIAAS